MRGRGGPNYILVSIVALFTQYVATRCIVGCRYKSVFKNIIVAVDKLPLKIYLPL